MSEDSGATEVKDVADDMCELRGTGLVENAGTSEGTDVAECFAMLEDAGATGEWDALEDSGATGEWDVLEVIVALARDVAGE